MFYIGHIDCNIKMALQYIIWIILAFIDIFRASEGLICTIERHLNNQEVRKAI